MSDDFLDNVDQTNDESSKDEKPFEFGIRLEVDNFSKVPIDEKIFSHPCVVHNLAWRIMVKRTEHMGKSRLGFFLVCDPDSKKVKSSWSCEAAARLYIIKKDDSGDHFTREIRHLFCPEENDWGYSSFLYWDYVCDPENKFILNDSVKFDVCIVADLPEGIELTYDTFKNVKKACPVKNLKTATKKENEDIKKTVKNLKSDLIAEFDTLTQNFRTEMTKFKEDLMKDITEQMKSMLIAVKSDMESSVQSETKLGESHNSCSKSLSVEEDDVKEVEDNTVEKEITNKRDSDIIEEIKEAVNDIAEDHHTALITSDDDDDDFEIISIEKVEGIDILEDKKVNSSVASIPNPKDDNAKSLNTEANVVESEKVSVVDNKSEEEGIKTQSIRSACSRDLVKDSKNSAPQGTPVNADLSHRIQGLSCHLSKLHDMVNLTTSSIPNPHIPLQPLFDSRHFS